MKKYRLKTPSFRFFETKWSRIGKNSAEFIISFLVGLVTCILEAILIAVIKIVLVAWKFFKKPGKPKDKSDRIKQNPKPKPLNRGERVLALIELLNNQPIEDNMDIGQIVDLTEGFSQKDLATMIECAIANKTDPVAKISDFISSINSNIVKEKLGI